MDPASTGWRAITAAVLAGVAAAARIRGLRLGLRWEILIGSAAP